MQKIIRKEKGITMTIKTSEVIAFSYNEKYSPSDPLSVELHDPEYMDHQYPTFSKGIHCFSCANKVMDGTFVEANKYNLAFGWDKKPLTVLVDRFDEDDDGIEIVYVVRKDEWAYTLERVHDYESDFGLGFGYHYSDTWVEDYTKCAVCKDYEDTGAFSIQYLVCTDCNKTIDTYERRSL